MLHNFILLLIYDNQDFDITNFYIFLFVFCALIFIAYLLYNFDKAKDKIKYAKGLLLNPFFHAILILLGSFFLVNKFGHQSNENILLNADLCEKHLNESINKGISFVNSGNDIYEFERSYNYLIRTNACWVQKNQFKNKWREKLHQEYKNNNFNKKRSEYLLHISDLFNNDHHTTVLNLEKSDYSSFEHFNYYNALANYETGDFYKPFPLLQKEYQNPERHPDFDKLFAESVYRNIGPEGFVDQYNNDQLFKELSFQKKLTVNFLNRDIFRSIDIKEELIFDKRYLLNLLFALFILITWTIYVRAIDYFDKEKWSQIIMALLFSIVSMFIVYFIFYGLFDYFITPLPFYATLPVWVKYIISIGIMEELVKVIPLFVIWWFTDFIDEPYDFLMYAALAGISFAFMHDVVNFTGYHSGMFFESGFFTSILQLSLSAIAVSSIVYAYTSNKRLIKFSSIFVFFIVASVLHGSYFYLTIEKPFLYQFAAIIIFFFILYFWQLLANNALNFSPHFTYQKKFTLKSFKYFLIICLCVLWMSEYLMIGFSENVNAANNFLTGNFIFSLLILYFAETNLFNFDYVRNYWKGFTLYNKDTDSSTYRSGAFAFSDLLSPNILFAAKSTHNYNGYDVIFSPDDLNYDLIQKFGGAHRGHIVDRKIIIPRANSSISSKGDPFWFVIKLNEPVNFGAENDQYLLLRFRDTNPKLENSNSQLAMLYYRPDLLWLEEEVLVLGDLNSLGWVDIEKI